RALPRRMRPGRRLPPPARAGERSRHHRRRLSSGVPLLSRIWLGVRAPRDELAVAARITRCRLRTQVAVPRGSQFVDEPPRVRQVVRVTWMERPDHRSLRGEGLKLDPARARVSSEGPFGEQHQPQCELRIAPERIVPAAGVAAGLELPQYPRAAFAI